MATDGDQWEVTQRATAEQQHLRVVGGDEKGSLKSETVKYGHETNETRTQEGLRWRRAVAYTKDKSVLSSERAPNKNRTVIVKE
jgi:hypothetical protein